MPLEAASFIDSLEPANPAATDQIRQADDHLRLIKQVLQNTFPNITGPVTLSQDDLNAPPVIPVGLICPFFGTEAPAGWGICNGATYDLVAGGTIVSPDLRGRVIIGASVSTPPNTILGAATYAVETNGAGAHTHTVDGGAHTHSTTTSSAPTGVGTLSVTKDASSTWDKSGGAGNPVTDVSLSGAASTHTHEVTVGSSTHSHAVSSAPNHSHTATVPVIQPSFALHMIIKL